LCEDNAANQQVICEHLSRVGLKTVVAENGKIGVDFVRNRHEKDEKQFDLIFMDMHMPVMDGLEAVSKIVEINPHIPIVALTANIMSNDREIYKNSGMVDYVGKPFTSQELWRCLMRFFTPVKWHAEDKTERLQKDSELRQRLINNFISNNKNNFAEIKNALNTNDIKSAHRIAHTLKTNAAQLGKTLLKKAAETVEHHLKNGENRVLPEQLEILKNELDAAVTELSSLVREPEPVSQGELLNEADVKKLFDELEFMLKECDNDCLSLTKNLRRIPGCEELIRQIERYDFKLAEETLAALKKSRK